MQIEVVSKMKIKVLYNLVNKIDVERVEIYNFFSIFSSLF